MSISFRKKLGYRLYAALYDICRLLPIRDRQAYFVMTHDSSAEGNCGVMLSLMQSRGFTCFTLTRAETASPRFILKSAPALARSRYVFLDNAFLPLAFFKVRRGTSVIQLWHGTGTVKKFGQHVNTGELKALEARCGRNISTVVVSSEATRSLYAECFGVPVEKVQILGLPRTDIFFDKDFPARARAAFRENFKFILYAPTFRDDPADEQTQLERISEFVTAFKAEMPADTVLGLRLHPSLAGQLQLSPTEQLCSAPAKQSQSVAEAQITVGRLQPGVLYQNAFGRPQSEVEHCTESVASSPMVLDLSNYSGINTLLGAADVLITDYSSIIFEYALLRRPMLFYAYDLERFENNDRGFYRDYRSYVPGPVSTDIRKLMADLKAAMAQPGSLSFDSFIRDSYAFTDGRSAERVLNYVLKL